MISFCIDISFISASDNKIFVELKELENNLIVFEDFRKKQLCSLSHWANQGRKWCFWAFYWVIQPWRQGGQFW